MTRPALELHDVTVRFGGLVAVDSLTLRAEPGVITGLIGPNGAGKSTTFNACTGVVHTSDGEIDLGGRKLNRLSTARRAQAGLGRTFQRMEIVDAMTVIENVRMGPEAIDAGHRPWGQLASGRGTWHECNRRAEDALERCGIADIRDVLAAELSTGQGRLLELARVIACDFEFLLLDEPSSGLDPDETMAFGDVVKAIVRESGVGVLLVEHDMALVRRLCSYIHVLDFGKHIYEGPADEVLSSAIVRAAYLGSEAAEEEVA